MSEEGKPVSNLGAALIGTTLCSPLIFMVLIIVFPVTWVGLASCSGRQHDLVTSGGKPVLVEEATLYGEESYLYQVFRVSLLDPQTGKASKGPWLLEANQLIGIGEGTVWLRKKTPLGLSLDDGKIVVDAKSLVAKQPALSGHLREEERAYHLDEQGRLIVEADDGRSWAVDGRLTVQQVQEWKARSSGSAQHAEAGALRFAGDGPRRTLGNADYLSPDFISDCETGKPIGTDGAFLVTHYERVQNQGMFVSLFGADGAERWKWKSSRPEERVTRAVQLGGVVVLQTFSDGTHGMFALELSSGKLLWTRGY